MKISFRGLDKTGKDVLIGTISTEGSDWNIQGDKELLENILQEPIAVRVDGEWKMVDADEDPKRFLEGLYLKYKSAYFRATKPE
jgi:hypothetical protein